MKTIDLVVEEAARAHRRIWKMGKDVSGQTKRSHKVCLEWQQSVKAHDSTRFVAEHCIDLEGTRAQKIDLVDTHDGVAYELKASPNNVHMEIYRDIFKALVHNRRNPTRKLSSLVFIAPEDGLKRLTPCFVNDVKLIAQDNGLELLLRPI